LQGFTELVARREAMKIHSEKMLRAFLKKNKLVQLASTKILVVTLVAVLSV
jgi:hypothetical protein